jgi:hypothetical protein
MFEELGKPPKRGSAKVEHRHLALWSFGGFHALRHSIRNPKSKIQNHRRRAIIASPRSIPCPV